MANFIVFYLDKNDTFYTEGDFSALLLKINHSSRFLLFCATNYAKKRSFTVVNSYINP
jgi:hypothetical protein